MAVTRGPRAKVRWRLVALIILSSAVFSILYAAFKLQDFENWASRVDHRLDLMRSDLDVAKGEAAFLALERCHSANCSHLSARFAMIQAQIAQAGHGGVLFLGDSNTEGAILPQKLCGKATINAGIGGATVGTFSNSAHRLLQEAKPSAIVIALGANDAWGSRSTPRDLFRKQYLALAKIASGARVPVFITTIPPVEAGKPLGDKAFSPEKIAEFNLEIAEIAREKKLALVDTHRSLSGEDGLAKKGGTTDGVHFSKQTYESWTQMLVDAVNKKLPGCDIQ